MRIAPLILKIFMRVLITIIFWLPLHDLITPLVSGGLLTEIQNSVLSLSRGDLSATVGMFAMVASVLALLAVLTLSINLYVVATIAVFLSSPPTLTQALLNVLGLIALLITNTYLISRRRVFQTGIAVSRSRTYYLLLVLGITIFIVGFAYLIGLYLEYFMRFVSSVPVTSKVRVLSEFLGNNPVGKALLLMFFIPLFVKISFDLMDSVAYFLSPNAVLARIELSKATAHSVEFKYPFRSLISLILSLFIAPPLYVVFSYIYTNYVSRILPVVIPSNVLTTSYSQLLNVFIKIVFFMIVWSIFSYVARFFRGYVNMRIIIILVALTLLFSFAVFVGGLNLDYTLTRVYSTYYRDFLIMGELLLQVTGFVP
ncbi:MAG: hypothetical protein QN229_02850 [Desulfurococcaceae archaeon TW002]